MRMRPPGPAHSARTRGPGAFRRWRALARYTRSEYRKIFAQLARSAMRTFTPRPITRAHQQFAVFLAGFTVKFVKRHRSNLVDHSRQFQLLLSTALLHTGFSL